MYDLNLCICFFCAYDQMTLTLNIFTVKESTSALPLNVTVLLKTACTLIMLSLNQTVLVTNILSSWKIIFWLCSACI